MINLERQLGPEWYKLLGPLFDDPVMEALGRRLGAVKNLTPPLEDLFRAYELVQPSQLRVLILGQDPYPAPGVAHGLAFSFKGRSIPYSLSIIFKELEHEGLGRRENADLTDWAKQGVMLLNTVLTTEVNATFTHRGWGWEKFTARTLQIINKLPQRLVVLAWGAPAQELVMKYIESTDEHLVLKTCHPAAQRYGPKFVGCQHFTRANMHLGMDRKIQWTEQH